MTKIVLLRQNISVAGHTIESLKNAQQGRVLEHAATELWSMVVYC